MNPKHLALLALPLLAACGAGGSGMSPEAERGARVYDLVCKSCHVTQVGPTLQGIIGRPVASIEGYAYSEAMLADRDQAEWTPGRIKSYIMGPMQMYPEGRMVMEPLSAEDADAVVAYLHELQ